MDLIAQLNALSSSDLAATSTAQLRSWLDSLREIVRTSGETMDRITAAAENAGATRFTRGQTLDFDAAKARNGDALTLIDTLEEVAAARSDVDRTQIVSGGGQPASAGAGLNGTTADGAILNAGHGSHWSRSAVVQVREVMPGKNEVRSGKLTVTPPLLERATTRATPGNLGGQPQPLDDLVGKGRAAQYPTRVIDLLAEPKPLTEANTFSYLRQTKRENNATVVADNASKPVSKYELTEIEDRCRVVAHTSEPVPLRLFDDNSELLAFLQAEMEDGVLDAVEAQVIAGSGSGENMRGIVNTTGVLTQAFATDLPTTLRKARTGMKVAGETPTAWVLHPEQTEAIDLLREGADGAFLAGNGWNTGIMGALPVVESISVDPDTAILADWTKLQLIIREDGRLDIDAGGALFDKNQARLRLEGRYGLALRRTTSFDVVSLAPVTP